MEKLLDWIEAKTSKEVVYVNTTGRDILINNKHLLKGIKRKEYGKSKPQDIDCKFDGIQWIENTSDFAKRIYAHKAKNSFKSEDFIELR